MENDLNTSAIKSLIITRTISPAFTSFELHFIVYRDAILSRRNADYVTANPPVNDVAGASSGFIGP